MDHNKIEWTIVPVPNSRFVFIFLDFYMFVYIFLKEKCCMTLLC